MLKTDELICQRLGVGQGSPSRRVDPRAGALNHSSTEVVGWVESSLHCWADQNLMWDKSFEVDWFLGTGFVQTQLLKAMGRWALSGLYQVSAGRRKQYWVIERQSKQMAFRGSHNGTWIWAGGARPVAGSLKTGKVRRKGRSMGDTCAQVQKQNLHSSGN